jgi:hypothetical protein
LVKRLSINRKTETLDPFAKLSKLRHSCIKTFLESSKIRQKLGIDEEVHAAIVNDPAAVERLRAAAQQTLNALVEKVRLSSIKSYETREHLFDVQFNPSGEKLFVATKGMRVFDWNDLLAANEDAPPPELSLEAPNHEPADPNSRPYAYSVRFDARRNLLLSSSLAGTIQYLNTENGQSGTLLKLPDEVSIWRLELTTDGGALCCHCGSRPSAKSLNEKFSSVQVWNYPALCQAAGLG